ncbi:MAG: hypothetical protein ACOYNY_03545 [Caldilineaceae bacterium]
MSYPTLDEFLALPIEEIAKVAPASLCYTPGGTRRAAAMMGIDPRSMQYAEWCLAEEFRSLDVIFRHGVRNVFLGLFKSGTFKHDYSFVDRLVDVALETITADNVFNHYNQNNWWVRLLCDDRVAKFVETARLLRNNTTAQSNKTLYWLTSQTPTDLIDMALRTACLHGVSNQKEAIYAMTGDNIEPITMLLSFGKPMVSDEIIPSILTGTVQCYWSQKPGPTLTDQEFRTILYDYAYTRNTSNFKKGDRALEATNYENAWRDGPTLGLGMRLGKSWYPAPMKSAAWEDEPPKANAVVAP